MRTCVYGRYAPAPANANFINIHGRTLKWQPYALKVFLLNQLIQEKLKQSLDCERDAAVIEN